MLGTGLALVAITFSTALGQGSGSAPPPKKAIRDPVRPVAVTPVQQVAVIPLKGTVGPCELGEPWFSCVDFAAAVEKAEKASIKTIILEIHSPGGFVRTEDDIIAKILEAQGRGVTFVALIDRDAGSAAALIALACRRIYATPAAKLGAAVTVLSGPSGSMSWAKAMKDDPELAAKYESFNAALHTEAAESNARCVCVSMAMRQMAAELWWSPTSGLSATKQGDSTEQVDSKTTVLTLTATQIQRLGIGETTTGRQDVLESLELGGAKVVDLAREMETSPKRLKQMVKQAVDLDNRVADSALREGRSQRGTTSAGTEKLRQQLTNLVDKVIEFVGAH